MITIWWSALFCMAIGSPLMYWTEHFDNKDGHVSVSLLEHYMNVGFGWDVGHNIFI